MLQRSLTFIAITSVLAVGCGRPAPKQSNSPSPEEQCKARGEGWTLVEGSCENTMLTSEEKISECHSRGPEFRWTDGACQRIDTLTAEQRCVLRGKEFQWDGEACKEKAAVVTIEDENFASCIRNTKRYVKDEATGETVQQKIDADEDGVLREDELNNVQSLSCYAEGIRSLSGIESMPNLKTLNCSANQITTMPDFSKLTNLEEVICENNDFSDRDCPIYLPLKERLGDSLLMEQQRDGRKLRCDQVEMVAHQGLTGADNRANDIWGFDLDGKQYVVWGDVTHINIAEAFVEAPYVKTVARLDRSRVAGKDMFKDANHTIWGEFRVYKKDGKAYLYASTEANWGLIREALEPIVETYGKKWCETDKASEILKRLEPAHSQLQIFDVTNLADADPAKRVTRIDVPQHPELRSMHNITIDETRGLLFAFGGSDLDTMPKFDEKRDRCDMKAKVGARLYRLDDPKRPLYQGYIGDLYVHDGQVTTKTVDGKLVTKLYLAHGSTAIHWEANRHNTKENRFAVYDISNLNQLAGPILEESAPNTNLNVPAIIDQQYPNGYCHNIWVNEDETHVVITGETSVNEQLSLWRLNYDTKSATQTSGVNFQGGPFAHNAFIEGDNVYVSHYSKGVVVLKLVPENGELVLKPYWSYDTFPEHSKATFNGSWGVYPFASITKDLFFATDIETGLYVFKKLEGL